MEFEFNVSKARKTISLFIVSSIALLVLLLLTDKHFPGQLSEYSYLFFSFLVVYVVFVLYLLLRLFRSFDNAPIKISLCGGELNIPSFYLGNRNVSLTDIYSLERIVVNNKSLGLVLGLEGRSRFYIDKACFINENDFEKFKDVIASLVSKNDPEKRNSINHISAFQETKRTYALYVISLLCFLIYIFFAFGSMENTESYNFLFAGAASKNILETKEYYRIFSSTFLHGDIFHLLFNLFVFALLGELLERVISTIRFTAIFLLSSFFAYFIFMLFSTAEYAVGASGGIYGLWGAYLYIKLFYEKYLPGSVNAIPLNRLIWLLIAQFLIEIFFMDNVGVANHMGGFIAGFLYLYIAPLGPELELVNKPNQIEKGLCLVLVASYSIGLSYFLLL